MEVEVNNLKIAKLENTVKLFNLQGQTKQISFTLVIYADHAFFFKKRTISRH